MSPSVFSPFIHFFHLLCLQLLCALLLSSDLLVHSLHFLEVLSVLLPELKVFLLMSLVTFPSLVVCMVYGVWCMVYDVYDVWYGVWGMVYGVWCMVCGVWCTVYGV